MMARSNVSLWVRLTQSVLVSALLVAPAVAQVARQGNDVLSSLAFVHEKLNAQDQIEPIGNVRSVMDKSLSNGWEAFRIGLPTNAEWNASVDKRTGLVTFAEGGNLAWVPGRGNRLTHQDLAGFLKAKPAIDLDVMDAIARDFLPRVKSLLGVDPAQLVLNRARSGQPAGHVWFVDYDVVRDGLVVEGARVVFRVNNGNLIQYGSENLPVVSAKVPATRLTAKQALAAVAQYIGGFQAGDTMRDAGSLHLLPSSILSAKSADGYEFGNGRGLTKVWQVTFKRAGVMGTWQAQVDATTGEVLSFDDVNKYASAQATGGTYLNSPTTGSEVVRPDPYLTLGTATTNSAGIYNNTAAVTSNLAGTYVKITDTCGSISQASDGSGNVAFGTSTGTDCTTPGHGGAGNTHASREQYYQVNRIKEVVRGWLPSNTWINTQLNVKVNLNQTCNAYWDGTALNFFKSGGGCNNTGEIAGVSLHEFGHGIDQNDSTGTATDGATGESYGDTTALIALHASCLGAGFLGSNCSGYGDACTSCTGVRDADFAKHSSNTPATADNFIRVRCPAASGGAGPCGKEVHCESYVPTETMWDLAARDLPSPGTGVAWTILDRLWYLSRNTATKSFSCTTGTTYTSNGCSAGSLWKVFRAIDDDNGNLNDGTPHGGALFAAFNRHSIACTTDTGASTTFAGCTPPASPTLSITGGSNTATLNWSASGTAVYDVFRNETGCNAGFTKLSPAAGTSGTTFTDPNIGNGLTYFYQVTAFPSGNEACASLPSTCVSVTPSGTACTPPAAPTGVTTSGTGTTTTTVSWTAVSGATSYKVFRATTSGGPYTQVGTSSTTSFADSGLACGTTYFYVVTASNGTCDSGNSAQTSTTTATCTCTPPAAPTGVATSGTTQTGTTVSWTASSGATSYKVFRATTSGGPYTQVGTSSTTSFADTGLTCNTSYFYVVTASNGTCDSGNSAQGSATTSACTGCTTHTQYSNTFDSASGLSDWTRGTFGGTSATNWRGVQACAPTHSGGNIFRYGGSTCTASYSNNEFNFAQPKGATGITIPAGATTNRLSFWHRRSYESGFDGGALTISVDGTNYEFIPSSAILSGNYNGTVNAACPPAGSAGAGIFTGASSSMTNTTVDLDAACNVVTGLSTGCAGHSVFIGFTSITDCSTTSTGWFLDDVTVTSCF